jgi:hypothetical protein
MYNKGRNTDSYIQSDSGLIVLASACVGQMFRLYKSNKGKYGLLISPLSKMIKTKEERRCSFIPVEQRSRDKGGLYCLCTNFLPASQNP